MAELIDRKQIRYMWQTFNDGKWSDGVTLQSIIDRMPTVDAVKVVRCKDCIHYDFGVCLKIYSDGAVSQYAWQARKEDDFCSYGEREDNVSRGERKYNA